MNLIASNRPFPGREVINPEELKSKLGIEYGGLVLENIFFPFWSWLVPYEVIKNYKCIGFHTGPVYGGSPIQNLIRNGISHSFIRMFKMNERIDAGEDILTYPVCLNGSLEEIMIRETDTIKRMIDAYLSKDKR